MQTIKIETSMAHRFRLFIETINLVVKMPAKPFGRFGAKPSTEPQSQVTKSVAQKKKMDRTVNIPTATRIEKKPPKQAAPQSVKIAGLPQQSPISKSSKPNTQGISNAPTSPDGAKVIEATKLKKRPIAGATAHSKPQTTNTMRKIKETAMVSD